MSKLIKPVLKENSFIGFVSPSAGLAGIYEYRVKRAIKWFEKSGFKVKLGKNCLKKGYIAGKPEERAKDINEMIYDKDVSAIISTIGGDHSIQILKYIDFKGFRKNPKVFVGFSDITVLHLAFYKISKVQTFYGPMVLTQFGEYPKPYSYTIKHFFDAVMRKVDVIDVKPTKYTDEFLDWGKFKTKARKNFKENKFYWLKEGKAEGKLIGGCIPSILRLAGTKYFPSFKDSIVFLETPEEEPGTPYPIEKVDSDLSQLIEIGVFDKAKGVVFGIFYRYNEKMREKAFSLILERLKDFDFPILCNVNFGHTDPIITIPYGAIGYLSSFENKFLIKL